MRNLLRLLAADLAIEALTVRRQWKEHDLAELAGHGGRWRPGVTPCFPVSSGAARLQRLTYPMPSPTATASGAPVAGHAE